LYGGGRTGAKTLADSVVVASVLQRHAGQSVVVFIPLRLLAASAVQSYDEPEEFTVRIINC